MKKYKWLIAVKILLVAVAVYAGCTQLHAQDAVADNMLMFQRTNGGWSKHLNGKAVKYDKTYTPAEQEEIKKNATLTDATIDNAATTKEIRYLVTAYKTTKNKQYLTAAENGIKYLLKAQYENGGWPQYYPDFSSYRSEITYNDNAMINVLTVLSDVANRESDMEVTDPAFVPQANAAIKKGIDCILKTQVKVNGKLTVWCAQYDAKTLQPAKARAYEFPSLSGSESVAIVLFLMAQPNPSQEIKYAINSAVQWFEASKISGYKFETIDAPGQPNGKDKALVADAGSTIWARFYEIETNEPFFSGRDGIKRRNVSEIDYERRNGYAWYGAWATKLLEKSYPKWKAKVGG